MYFSRSLGRPRRLVSTRSTWACIDNTAGGRKPRSPSASLSCSVKAVPLLRSGSRNSARPHGEGGWDVGEYGAERALMRSGLLTAFPQTEFMVFLWVSAH